MKEKQAVSSDPATRGGVQGACAQCLVGVLQATGALAHSFLEFWSGALLWFNHHKAGFQHLTGVLSFLSVVLSQQGVDQEEQGTIQSGFSHYLSPRTVLVTFLTAV